MTDAQSELSDAVKALREKFGEEAAYLRIQSTAQDAPTSVRIDQLTLPDQSRSRMPFTQDKYIIKENPQLVQWEREARKFLRNLNLTTGHRISAVMIFEWATGLAVKDLVTAGEPPRGDLLKLNKILRFYFGKGYTTNILGKKVQNAYRVPQGWRVKRHRPMTMTLYGEFAEGVLNP